jgi:hypothetical protein
MAKKSELEGLMKWCDREDWRDLYDEVVDDHFALILEDYNLSFDRLEELVGEIGMNSMWGCAFEDFATRVHPELGLTPIDDYLKRRGWKESASNRRYILAVRDSIFSIYQVGDVVPGQSMVLRDTLIPGEAPLAVIEHTATRMLKSGDFVGARVVEVDGVYRVCGSLQKFSAQAAHRIQTELVERLAPLAERIDEIQPDGEAESDVGAILGLVVVQQAAPRMTQIWLENEIAGRATKRDAPHSNSAGEQLEFHQITYTLGADEDTVAERLDQILQLKPEGDYIWNWIESDGAMNLSEPSQMVTEVRDGRFYTMLEDGTTVLASISVGDGFLVASANSKKRADGVMLLLKAALKAHIGEPTTKVFNYEELRTAWL